MAKIIDYTPEPFWAMVKFETWERVRYERILIAMSLETYWWSFVNALWVALSKADEENTFKILNTFDNYVKDYIEKFLYTKKQI